MKKIACRSLALLIAAAAFWACEQDTLMLYEGTSDVYFTTLLNRKDSAEVHFWFKEGDSWPVGIPVRITGEPTATDRSVRVVVVDSLTTAKRVDLPDQDKDTIHYEVSELVIPAGKVEGTLTVTTFRTLDLAEDKDTVVLTLALQPIEHFGTTLATTVDANTKKDRDLLTYKISISNVLSKPSCWDDMILGTFSEKKLNLISQLNDNFPPSFLAGVPWNGITLTPGFAGNASTFIIPYGVRTQLYLDEQAANGTPVFESDGVTPMAMAAFISSYMP